MEDKIAKIVDFLENNIAELYGYANSEDYDDLEQHDCRIAAEECEFILDYVKSLL